MEADCPTGTGEGISAWDGIIILIAAFGAVAYSAVMPGTGGTVAEIAVGITGISMVKGLIGCGEIGAEGIAGTIAQGTDLVMGVFIHGHDGELMGGWRLQNIITYAGAGMITGGIGQGIAIFGHQLISALLAANRMRGCVRNVGEDPLAASAGRAYGIR